VSAGKNNAETWRVIAKRAVPEDLGAETAGKLKFLLSPNKREGSGSVSPGEIAWLLGLEEQKVAAIARGSVVADLGYELRVRVCDPAKDNVTFELKRGNRNPRTIARFTRSVRDILSQPDWTLPLKERAFDESSEGTGECLPKFVASVQFLGVQPAVHHVHRGRFISDVSRSRTNSLLQTPMVPKPRDAVCRRRLSTLSAVDEDEEDSEEDGGAKPQQNKKKTVLSEAFSPTFLPNRRLSAIREDSSDDDARGATAWCGQCNVWADE